MQNNSNAQYTYINSDNINGLNGNICNGNIHINVQINSLLDGNIRSNSDILLLFVTGSAE